MRGHLLSRAKGWMWAPWGPEGGRFGYRFSRQAVLRLYAEQMDANKVAEIETKAASVGTVSARTKPFGPEWGTSYWTKWATISHALTTLGITPGASLLDVGVGTGWTSVFLAESGFDVTGVDIAPASVEIGDERAARYGVNVRFETADMDYLDLGRTFDAVLVFDALHHSVRQAQVIAGISRHLAPGGWVLFGEPSVLHHISPSARRASREEGWVERGVSPRKLKHDCRAAGLNDFRRFYEGTAPITSSPRHLLWQATRLVASRVAFAPQASVWLAARKG